MNSFKNIWAISSLSLLSVGSFIVDISPVSAATVKFEMDFIETGRSFPGIGGLDDSFAGTKVGSGEFSYDDEVETCVIADIFSTCIDPQEGQTNLLFVNNAITDFNLDIYGANVNEEDIGGDAFWWSDGEQLAGQQAVSRDGPSIETGRWSFGDFVDGFLLMDFTESSDTFGQGTWQGFNLTSLGENGQPIATPSSAEGTWLARRVEDSQSTPEPSAILGMLIVMSSSYYLKKHRSQL